MRGNMQQLWLERFKLFQKAFLVVHLCKNISKTSEFPIEFLYVQPVNNVNQRVCNVRIRNYDLMKLTHCIVIEQLAERDAMSY